MLSVRVEQLSMAIEHMHQGMCMYDSQGRFVLGNTSYAQALGLPLDRLQPGMSGAEVLGAMREHGHCSSRTVDEIERQVAALCDPGTSAIVNFERSDGCTFAIRHRRTHDGCWVATFADITNEIGVQRRAEAALKESEERFRLAAEAAGFGVWDYDTALARRSWSDRLREIFGFGPDTVPGLEIVLALVHAEDRVTFLRHLQRIRDDVSCSRFETCVRIHRADDGKQCWISVNGWKTVKAESPMGRIIMTVRDVTDEKLIEERIVWSASHDALTGLANRSYFHAQLQLALKRAAQAGTSAGLLLLDIDRFKQVNDTLGHDAGDRLLQMFGRRLRAAVRAEDTIARIGGDEFAIILGEVDGKQQVGALAESILKRLLIPFTDGSAVMDCRASIGAALYPQDGASLPELMKHADLALYASKASGRGTSTFFDPAMKARVQRRGAMLRRARRALDDDALFPFYQPKVNLRTGRISGLEALLRWRSRRGQICKPGALGPAFEDPELANAISERMIDAVIADMDAWLCAGIEFGHVALNASAAEFCKDDFAERVLERLAAANIATCHLELEVTEAVFLGCGTENIRRAVKLLNQEGVRIALDDFGTGYASLCHLKEFPVDTIKIDRSFVRDMEQDEGSKAIVRAVVNLGRAFGISVVAEGIENRAQAEHLVQLDCDHGQGFLFSRAVPASRVPALVQRSTLLPDTRPENVNLGGLRLVAR